MTHPSAQPIVENFIIRGLNGYKTIQLGTTTAAQIISAENGTGKTTVLNALYGVLSGKYSFLHSLDFQSLSIKFAGQPEISATREELMDTTNGAFAAMPRSLLKYFTDYMNEGDLRDLIDAFRAGPGGFEELPLFRNFWLESPHSKEDIFAKINEVINILPQVDSMSRTFSTNVASGMAGNGVIYFPTYRRIEADIPEYSGPRERPRFQRKSYQIQGRRGEKLINFGLRDVEMRLEDITDDIRRGTFEAYARISGRTLDQLVSRTREAPADQDSYNIAAIKVVLGRIGKSGSATEKRIVELIETKEISRKEHDYLRYFLDQMVQVYREKQLQESAVEKFVKVVGSYWSGLSGEKTFEFDKVSAEAAVRNRITGEKLKLNALSSGEKQVISTFSQLYLELEQKYVVLIDEPELSLSMEWQRKFLPDILAADSCSQLIAITHSPFVFDNDLDPFAAPLTVLFSKPETR